MKKPPLTHLVDLPLHFRFKACKVRPAVSHPAEPLASPGSEKKLQISVLKAI
jgi:hypothetical protein